MAAHRSAVGPVCAAVFRKTAARRGTAPVSGSGLSGGSAVRAVHRHAVDGGAVSASACRAGRRAGGGSRSGSGGGCWRPSLCSCAASYTASVGWIWSRVLIVRLQLVEAKKGARRSRARCARKQGSRYHLAVDANGLPLAVTAQRPATPTNSGYLLPPCRPSSGTTHLTPHELWADRGYWSAGIRQALSDRQIEPRISHRRNPGEARSPPGTPTRDTNRGRPAKKRIRPAAPARPLPLANRTHQRLAARLPPHPHPPRPQARQLPRLRHTRDEPDPGPPILSSAPDPDFGRPGVRPLNGSASATRGRARWRAGGARSRTEVARGVAGAAGNVAPANGHGSRADRTGRGTGAARRRRRDGSAPEA